MKTSILKRAAICIIAVASITTPLNSHSQVFSVIAEETALVPVTPFGAKFGKVRIPARAAHSPHVAFLAGMKPGFGGVTPANDQAIFVGLEVAPMVAVREGDIVPDASGNPTSAQFAVFRDPLLLSSNVYAFPATISGVGITTTNNRGLWSTFGGAMHQVARSGDVAPGTGGAKFKDFYSFVLPESGDVVFYASLEIGTGTPAVTLADDKGVWGYDFSAPTTLIKIIRTGDSLFTKTVRSITFATPVSRSPGQSRSFGEDGNLEMRVTFTTGFSAIVAVAR